MVATYNKGKHMKKIVLLLRKCICGVSILLFVVPQPVLAATEITGKVTEKRHDSVKVTFEVQNNASPAIGDRVDFKKVIQGYAVKAGYGEVTTVKSGFVWVRVVKKPVDLAMTGVITIKNNKQNNTIENKTTTDIKQFFPLKIGRYWKYETKERGQKTRFSIDRIVAKKTIAGKEWFVVAVYEENKKTDTYLLR